jgi:hypothetical protein
MDFLFPGVVDSSLSFPFGRIELNLQKIALLCTNIIHRLEVVLFPWEHLVLRNPHSKLTRLGTPQKDVRVATPRKTETNAQQESCLNLNHPRSF